MLSILFVLLDSIEQYKEHAQDPWLMAVWWITIWYLKILEGKPKEDNVWFLGEFDLRLSRFSNIDDDILIEEEE